ncbi:calcium/sodium antiporter [bacterium]|nr:calcium/sodium antiporter [bacterium]
MGASFDLSTWPLWGNGLVAVGTIGLIALGAHWLVESASRLAAKLGVSELIIGLTVVALGTSAPEFAVTILSALSGHGDISVSNIVGSNIFNLGFILGGCALVRAIPMDSRLLKRDGVVLGGSTLLLLVLVGADLTLGRFDGALLFGLLLVYLVFLFLQRGIGKSEAQDSTETPEGSLLQDVLIVLVSLVAIVAGSHFLVESAVAVAKGFGVSEWAIGVTVVAAGTSAPELAISLAGVIKGRYAISAGNIIGSNIFNLLGVLGLAGMLHPVQINPVARISLIALSGLVLLALLLMRTGWKLSRREGLILVLVAAAVWISDFSMHAMSH